MDPLPPPCQCGRPYDCVCVPPAVQDPDIDPRIPQYPSPSPSPRPSLDPGYAPQYPSQNAPMTGPPQVSRIGSIAASTTVYSYSHNSGCLHIIMPHSHHTILHNRRCLHQPRLSTHHTTLLNKPLSTRRLHYTHLANPTQHRRHPLPTTPPQNIKGLAEGGEVENRLRERQPRRPILGLVELLK